jgi:branched-chain amino acid transport system ATP-binding protein
LTTAAPQPADIAAGAGGPVLEVRRISKRFGALQVLEDVALRAERGEALGIIGPNGAGKTTLLDLIAGASRPDAGTVVLAGRELGSLGAAARCRLGIGRTHQIPRPFAGMTVFENALVAATMGARLRGSAAHDKALDALEMTGMLALGNRPAAALGLLDRKRLELARALATGPELLLLDEIAGGLTEAECAELVQLMRDIKDAGITIVWVEHVVHALLAVVSRLMVLNFGRKIIEGEPRSVMASAEVREIYMGIAA